MTDAANPQAIRTGRLLGRFRFQLAGTHGRHAHEGDWFSDPDGDHELWIHHSAAYALPLETS